MEGVDDLELDDLLDYMLEEGRFSNVTDDTISAMMMKSYSKQSLKKMKEMENLFSKWVNATLTLRNIERKKLEDYSMKELNVVIAAFILEVRKVNGEEYRAETLKLMVYRLQMCLQRKGKYVRFMVDDELIGVRNCLDNKMKELSTVGLGSSNKSRCSVVEVEHEEKMWEVGALGDSNLTSLVRTLVFTLGLHLGLRTGEHRSLRFQNFKFYGESVKYTEFSSKVQCRWPSW